MTVLFRMLLSLAGLALLTDVCSAYPYQHYVEESADRHRVEPALIRAVMHAESAYDQYALSHKGAIGLMQLMITTAREYEPWVARFQLQEEPDVNIDIGTRHLKDLDRQVRRRYPHVEGLDRIKLVAAAYNAGWGRVVRAGGRVPPIWETRGYVRRVSRYYQSYGGALKPVKRPQAETPVKKTGGVKKSVSPETNKKEARMSTAPAEAPPAISTDFQLTRHTLMVLFISLLMFLGYVVTGWSHLIWIIRHHTPREAL